MRIATTTISDNIVRQIQTLASQQAKLQAQVASGQRITQPEDDPAAIGRVLGLASEHRALDQYSSNSQRALNLSQSSYSGLQQIKKISDRATEIGTLGGGATSADARQSYATELDQLIEQAVQLGNTKFGNDYLYAGTKVDTAPVNASRDPATGQVVGVNYNGNANQSSIPLSETATLAPGTSGTTNQGIVDFINHLVALRDALTTNNPAGITTAQTDLITTEDGFVSDLAEQGAVQMRIEVNQSQQTDRGTNLDQLVSTEVNADMPSTIVKLNQSATAYQAALQSAASIMKISLLDYIK